MSNLSRGPSSNVARKPVSPSPFNPPDLPPLSAHVASGTAMPSPTQAPPPTPPPKDRPPEATPPFQTPQQGRPSTPDFFLQNSTYSMPGAYPTTPGAYPITRTLSSSPLAADPRTQTTETETPPPPQPITPSPGKRRSSGNSIRTLLSSLRRPSTQSPRDPGASGDLYRGGSSARPDTPSRDSMASLSRPSLRKKMSGSFWGKRQSSLGMEIGMNRGDQDANAPATHNEAIREIGQGPTPHHPTVPPVRDEASESESVGNHIPSRKSGTFWTSRRSSLGNELNAQALAPEPQKGYQSPVRITSTAPGPSSADQSPESLPKKKSGTSWSRKLSMSLQRETEASRKHEGTGNGRLDSPRTAFSDTAVEEPEMMSEEESYMPVERPSSPPPKLPELNLDVGGGRGSFINGGAEDLFGHIGRD